MKKKKKDTRRYGSFWTCPNCFGTPEFSHEKMMAHMQEKHSINPAKTKGKRNMLMHFDADTWFSSSYEWEIAGLKFTQSVCTNRSGENAAMWASE